MQSSLKMVIKVARRAHRKRRNPGQRGERDEGPSQGSDILMFLTCTWVKWKPSSELYNDLSCLIPKRLLSIAFMEHLHYVVFSYVLLCRPCYMVSPLKPETCFSFPASLVMRTNGVTLTTNLPVCPARCDPMDCSLPGTSVHGLLQARLLEWLTILFSRWSFWPSNIMWKISWTKHPGGLQSMGSHRVGHDWVTDTFTSSAPLVGQQKIIHLWCRKKKESISHVWLFLTPWTVTCQASLSMEFSRKEYWNG